MKCVYPGCGEFGKPLRGIERVTSRPVWLCFNCKGRMPRPSDRDRERPYRRSLKGK